MNAIQRIRNRIKLKRALHSHFKHEFYRIKCLLYISDKDERQAVNFAKFNTDAVIKIIREYRET
jgi:hypothetical protein